MPFHWFAGVAIVASTSGQAEAATNQQKVSPRNSPFVLQMSNAAAIPRLGSLTPQLLQPDERRRSLWIGATAADDRESPTTHTGIGARNVAERHRPHLETKGKADRFAVRRIGPTAS